MHTATEWIEIIDFFIKFLFSEVTIEEKNM